MNILKKLKYRSKIIVKKPDKDLERCLKCEYFEKKKPKCTYPGLSPCKFMEVEK